MSGSDTKNRWVCPNDRELTLRARLDSGWSVKSLGNQNAPAKSEQINESEQEIILKVIRKAQQTEQMEKERINRLLERLNNMKRNAKGDGKSTCVLCNEEFGLFGAQCHQCKDCNKSVCSKCGIDTFTQENEPFWLCKLCSETRELWKKSGAWFLNTLPTYGFTSNSIPMIKSPISDGSSTHSSSVPPSPVVRRRIRSPSPRSHRMRSPEITDYSTVFDANRPEDAYYERMNSAEKDEFYNALKQREKNISTNNLNYDDTH